jgi:hypothetical protein
MFVNNIVNQWKTIAELCQHQVIDVPEAVADHTVAVCQNLYKKGFQDALKEVQRLF